MGYGFARVDARRSRNNMARDSAVFVIFSGIPPLVPVW